ncbi:MAG: hypothetical protein ABI645_04775 [Pseudomonadota bacterium]
MYAMLAIVVQVAMSSATVLAIAPYSIAAGANFESLLVLGLVSAVLSTIGLVGTSWYLSRRLKPTSGITVGWMCGLSCSGILGLAIDGRVDYSLILYLSVLAPTLLAVLLASLLDRPKSGWQT